MTAEVVPFPNKAAVAQAETNDTDDIYGPPLSVDAWICLPCDEDPEVNPDGKFCFYVTREGVHCWTCHAVQHFPCE